MREAFVAQIFRSHGWLSAFCRQGRLGSLRYDAVALF
jgi:hypothetical protein